MSRIDADEQFIHSLDIDGIEHPHIHSDPDAGQGVESLVISQFVRMAQQPVGTSHMIKQRILFLFQQYATGIFFVRNKLPDHRVDAFDDLRLTFPQGTLIGNLKQVAPVIGSLSENAADSQIELTSLAGVLAEPAAACAYASLLKDRDHLVSVLGEDADVVVLLTGTGFKDMKAFDGRVKLPEPIENSVEEVKKLKF